MSFRNTLPNSSGVLAITSSRWAIRACFTSATCSTDVISLCRRATVALGVPAGAMKPNEMPASQPAKPDSAWFKAADRELLMGQAYCDWIGWETGCYSGCADKGRESP